MLTWTLRIRPPPVAVTVMGACGLTPELPPAGEMAGGTLAAPGLPALPAVCPAPPEQAASTRPAPRRPWMGGTAASADCSMTTIVPVKTSGSVLPGTRIPWSR